MPVDPQDLGLGGGTHLDAGRPAGGEPVGLLQALAFLREGYRGDRQAERTHDLDLEGGEDGPAALLEVEVRQGDGEEVDAAGELEVLELVEDLQRQVDVLGGGVEVDAGGHAGDDRRGVDARAQAEQEGLAPKGLEEGLQRVQPLPLRGLAGVGVVLGVDAPHRPHGGGGGPDEVAADVPDGETHGFFLLCWW
ncbi:hypothetical protein [Streptomyces nanshensis]|uniref:hypothetical protein n=1 Tax=Streptomyces nanshensis TaxID=518642 RepID=UPI00142D9A46|nr:hypothetical protein [Streptomyces nanshensis]